MMCTRFTTNAPSAPGRGTAHRRRRDGSRRSRPSSPAAGSGFPRRSIIDCRRTTRRHRRRRARRSAPSPATCSAPSSVNGLRNIETRSAPALVLAEQAVRSLEHLVQRLMPFEPTGPVGEEPELASEPGRYLDGSEAAAAGGRELRCAAGAVDLCRVPTSATWSFRRRAGPTGRSGRRAARSLPCPELPVASGETARRAHHPARAARGWSRARRSRRSGHRRRDQVGSPGEHVLDRRPTRAVPMPPEAGETVAVKAREAGVARPESWPGLGDVVAGLPAPARPTRRCWGLADIASATARASRVLPTPPAPVSDTSHVSSTEGLAHRSCVPRPTMRLSCASAAAPRSRAV